MCTIAGTGWQSEGWRWENLSSELEFCLRLHTSTKNQNSLPIVAVAIVSIMPPKRKASVSTDSASTAPPSRPSSKSVAGKSKSGGTRHTPDKTIAKTPAKTSVKKPAKISAYKVPVLPEPGALEVLSDQVNELLGKSSKTRAAVYQLTEQVTQLEDRAVVNVEFEVSEVKDEVTKAMEEIGQGIADVKQQVGKDLGVDMMMMKMEMNEMKEDVEEIKNNVHRLVRKMNQLLESSAGTVVHIHRS